MAIITVFIGSERPVRQGDHVGNWMVTMLKQRGHTVHVLDPTQHHEIVHLHVPFHYNKNPSKEMQQVHEWLAESDGFILVSPEYNHSYGGTLKNMIDNFMPEYEKKPFGIATYSIGPFGGVRANEALRPIISELKGVATPIPFMISSVQNVFDEQGALRDETIMPRFTKFIENFEWYVDALSKARDKK